MKLRNMKSLLFPILFSCSTVVWGQHPTPVSQMERLNRSVVALPASTGIFISWRLLGTDPAGTTFDLYSGTKLLASDLFASNYTDKTGTILSGYHVVVKNNGTPVDTTKVVQPWDAVYKNIKLDRPAAGADYSYFPQEASAADLDGDGDYDLVIKWLPTNWKDNANAGITGPTIIDGYKMDGTKLWRIDLGPNIRSGSHYTQFMVYDFDGDGKAEMICKTAPGSRDGMGNYVSQAADDIQIMTTDNHANYTNPSGYILSGPEYLSVFDGQTGKAMHTIWYNPNRGFTVGESANYSSLWGDSYGNRGDRYLACVAYLDGPDHHPSAVMCRGYYTRSYLWAVDYQDGKLNTKWLHASVSKMNVTVTDSVGNKTTTTYRSNTTGTSTGFTAYGQGCHNISVADVDGDGSDEIIYGGAAIDNNGSLLYSTGLGHGDAQHLGDLLPDRPGLEYFQVHEDNPYGWDVRDARTGEIILHVTGTGDTGRGMAADIDADHRGYEFWSSESYDVYDTAGQAFSTNRPPYCFRVYWDGDCYDELLDHSTVYKLNSKIMRADQYGKSQTFGTKAAPCLSADLLGDWREEIVFFSGTDSSSVNVFTTNIETKYALPTLMHDHTYRMGVAWENAGYNQPPHLGYYLSDSLSVHFQSVTGPTAQTVIIGDSMRAVSRRYSNCSLVTLNKVLLDGSILPTSMPTGFELIRDGGQHTYTITGKPTQTGRFQFVFKSFGAFDSNNKSDTVIVVVTSTATIENPDIKRTNERVIYYDVAGRKVDQPDKPGIYIRQKNNITQKILVK